MQITKFDVVFLILAALAGTTSWWLWGREPYIEFFDGPWDPTLIYIEPKWYGWENKHIRFSLNVPLEHREAFPDAEGWWVSVAR